MPHRPIVRALLLDIDSTLHPADRLFVKYLRQRHGIVLERDEIDVWDFWRRYGLSLEDWLDLIDSGLHSDDEILAADPYPGAAVALARWGNAGTAIHVVSDRHPRTAAATAAWLERIGVPATRLELAPGVDKLAYAKRESLDLIIDDKPSLLEDCVEQGQPAAALIQPYNRAVLLRHPQIHHGADWTELANQLEHHFRFGA